MYLHKHSHKHTHYLHGTDTEAPVNDELAEGGGPLVAVSAMYHEQSAQVLELSHREISSQGSLLAFLRK